MRSIKTRLISVLLVISFITCAYMSAPKNTTLDIKTRKVYENAMADYIITSFMGNVDECVSKYDGRYLMVLGKVTSISSDNKTVNISNVNSDCDVKIKCTTKKSDIISEVADISVGDIVKVYGTMSVDTFMGASMSLSIDGIFKCDEEYVYSTSYSVISGLTFDKNDMLSRKLNNGKVSYYIPESWGEVEYNLNKESNYFYCNQYRLNEYPVGNNIDAESVFVFYFSNQGLENLNNKSKTDRIMVALICNILNLGDKKLSFPYAKKTTDYGVELKYYTTSYNNLSGSGYHVEFVMLPVGTDGICGIMYVFKEAIHIDEIMLVLRMLETE